MRCWTNVLCVVLLGLSCAACGGEQAGDGDRAGPAVTATPLRTRKPVDGKRFLKLDPKVSGLSFENRLRRENTVAYVYMGAGLAVGDYDDDGLPDVYLISQDGPNKLFRQTAPLQFEDVTAKVGSGLDGGDAWGTAASFADVDGDGDLDLYVCNLESPNLLFVNDGGRFVEKAGMFGLGMTAASTGCAFADYDNDGDLDLYLLTNRVFRPTLPKEIVQETTPPSRIQKSKQALLAPELTFEYRDHVFMAGQRDRLFRNDGYAQFVDVTDEAGLDDHGNGLSVVWWDFDGDGDQDLYVANDFQSPDLLWRNEGDGTFEDVTGIYLPHTAFFGMGCDFADIDGDLRMDLCVADMSSTTHYMGKMLMGSMDQHRWFLMNSDPQQYMRNALYVNSGTSRFLECAHMAGLSSTDWTWTVRFCDLDEDGRQDFYATNGIPVFADNPDIGARVQELWGQQRYEAALDVLRNMPRVDEKNIARRNVADLKFEDIGAEWGLDESGVTHGAVVVDLDRDGDLDIVTNNLNAEASVFENRTADTHRLLVELRGANGNTRGVGASIEVDAGGTTQVRQVSLTRGYMSAGEAVEHFGLGTAQTVDEVRVIWPGGGVQRIDGCVADQHLVIRQRPEVAVREPDEVVQERFEPERGTAFVVPGRPEREFDDFAVQPLLPHRLSRLGPGIAICEAGDEQPLVWIGAPAGEPGRIWKGLGRDWFEQGEISSVVLGDTAAEDMGGVFVDYDSDGDMDLYVGSGGVEVEAGDEAMRDRLYQNIDGRFERVLRVPDIRTSTSCVVAADYDRDGDVDLFVGARVVPGRYPHAPGSVLLRNDGGGYVDATDEVAPMLRTLGMVTSACWTDLDDDGFVDLVVGAHWQPLRVLQNVDGERFEDRTAGLGIDGIRGQWNGVTSADLDGDGDMDLVATNLGLNTKYKASAAKPMEVYARDFDGNGTMDVVEAKHSGSRTLPVRGLSCSSQAMPFVREKFPTYDQFARATLGEIYGEALDESLALSCTELRHAVFENRGDRMVLHALPRRAQVSIAHGVLARDLDHDGVVELVLAHNFWSPEPETGRFDGGLSVLLRHAGGVSFEAVPPVESLLVMPGDLRGVALYRYPGRGSLLAFAHNDAEHQFFYWGDDAGCYEVALAGPPGNPRGYGARVRFERDGKPTIVREVLAGDGYLTQSTTLLQLPLTVGMVRVRWPDGRETSHEADGRQSRATLRYE